MNEVISIYKQFVNCFGSSCFGENQISNPISDTQMDQLETELMVCFPESLALFLQHHGPVRLDKLSQACLFTEETDIPIPINEFWGQDTMKLANGTPWLAPIPSEISGTDKIESANAFDYLFSFAGDDQGNWFCFRRIDCNAKCKDLPVFFFDHDGGEIEQIAEGLEDLIRLYMRVSTG